MRPRQCEREEPNLRFAEIQGQAGRRLWRMGRVWRTSPGPGTFIAAEDHRDLLVDFRFRFLWPRHSLQ